MTEHAPRAVVTAGTGGIGLETALGLTRRGWDVTLVARDPARAEAAVARVDEAAGRTAGRFVRADLSSLAATRRPGEHLAAEGALNLPVNNVGGMWSERWESPEGIEGSIALNHLSPYVLTETLLDALAAAAPSRVVNVTSSAITAAQAVFEDAEPPGPHYGLPATGRAKLAHLAHSMELAGRLAPRGISVIAADPGAAATGNAALMTLDILPPHDAALLGADPEGCIGSRRRRDGPPGRRPRPGAGRAHRSGRGARRDGGRHAPGVRHTRGHRGRAPVDS